MKICIKAGIILFTILLELLLSNFLVLNTIKPDLILIVVICMSLISGPEEGTAVGFIGGMLKDIFSVHYLGVNALVKTVIGYIAGLTREKIFPQHLMWIVVISTFVFTLANNMAVYFILKALHTDYDFSNILQNIIFSQAILNCVLSPFVFVGINKIFTYGKRWS